MRENITEEITTSVTKVPNLIYPDGRDINGVIFSREKIEEPSFIRDLDIPYYLSEIFTELYLAMPVKPDNEPPEGRGRRFAVSLSRLVSMVYSDGVFDTDFADYRLDVQEYLMANPESLNDLFTFFKTLFSNSHFEDKFLTKNFSLGEFLRYAEGFKDLIYGFTPFSGDVPKALQELNEHVEHIREGEFLGNLENLLKKIDGGDGTRRGFDVEMVWRCKPDLTPDRVVSAQIRPTDYDDNETDIHFDLGQFNYQKSIHEPTDRAVDAILQRALDLELGKDGITIQDQMIESYKLLPQLALYLAHAMYSSGETARRRSLQFCRPSFSDEETKVVGAQNLVMSCVQKRDSVGNPINHSLEESIIVISGPNAGGKSIYLKTIGLMTAMAFKGFYISAESAMFRGIDGIYPHFPKEDSTTEEGSKHVNNVNRMNEISRVATPQSLLLLDEPFDGTNREMAVTETIDRIKTLARLGCPVFITTHLEEVVNSVENGEIKFTRNDHLGFSLLDGQFDYTYKLENGPAVMDYNVELARRYGSDESTLNRELEVRASEQGFTLRNI